MQGEVRNWGGISVIRRELVRRQKVLGDPQIKDDTEAQIIIIRASLDLNAVTRNTITFS